MTCRKCGYQWCWLCMGEWKNHKDFYSCDYKDKIEEIDKKRNQKAQDLYKDVRLLERSKEQRNAAILTIQNVAQMHKTLDYFLGQIKDRSETEKQEFKKNFKFYEEALRLTIKMRFFISGTYPLLCTIQNQERRGLFLIEQQLFEINLDKLSKLLEEKSYLYAFKAELKSDAATYDGVYNASILEASSNKFE